MGWTVLPYTLATGGAVTDQDMSAIADAVFTTRSSHFILTEPYVLGAAFATATNLTRVNIQIPVWNAYGRANIYPHNLGSDILSPPQVMWLIESPPPMPVNEEITVKATDAVSQQVDVALMIFTPGHTRNLPRGEVTMFVRATFTETIVAQGWGLPTVLTMEQSLRGGVWSMMGAQVIGSHAQYFRVLFPRARQYRGRFLRPGWLCQNALADKEEPRMQINPYYLGEWGRFHTFELPQIEVYGNTAGSTAFEARFWLTYLGQDTSLLDGWVTQGWQ